MLFRFAFRAFLLLIALPIIGAGAFIGVEQFNRLYPTRLLCGRVVDTQEAADAVARDNNLAGIALYRDHSMNWAGDYQGGRDDKHPGCAVEYWVQIARCGGMVEAWKTRVPVTPESRGQC